MGRGVGQRFCWYFEAINREEDGWEGGNTISCFPCPVDYCVWRYGVNSCCLIYMLGSNKDRMFNFFAQLRNNTIPIYIPGMSAIDHCLFDSLSETGARQTLAHRGASTSYYCVVF